MRTRAFMIFVAMLAIAIAVPAADEECQVVGVLDPCSMALDLLYVGGYAPTSSVGLAQEEAAGREPYGFAFATVPEYAEFFSFVAQGGLLRIVDIRKTEPVKTIDLASELDLPPLTLMRLHAAGPVNLEVNPTYPLYATGTQEGAPWLWILDQEKLLGQPSGWSSALLASVPLSAGYESYSGIGVDVAVGGTTVEGGIQEAYVSALHWVDGSYRLQIYRVVVYTDLSVSVFLDSSNDEGVPVSGSAILVNGLDFDGGGTIPFGVFQTTAVVRNLSTGADACTLPGDPNDVTVWGPAPEEMDHSHFLFATSSSPEGVGRLLGYPAGECPDGGLASLEISYAGHPRALASSSDTSTSPWIYVADREGKILAVNVAIGSTLDGDRIDVLEVLDIPVSGGCPWEVAIRDESYFECELIPLLPDPGGPSLDCDGEDADDPRCDEDKPTHIDDPNEP